MFPTLMPVYARSDVEPVRGEGAYLFDAHGREWLDFASGIAVNSLGHGHPHLVHAIREQAGRLMHTSNLYKVPAQQQFADRLVARSFADTVFFTNSGAEALECAIKTCRRYQFAKGHPERFRILTFNNAFHGRTLATISATNQEKLRSGFEPLPDWFTTLPFNDADAVRAALTPEVAGILVEPVQGEGGIRPATFDFLRALRQLADENDILLIFDEVQCGVARTGSLFAYQHYGIEPDIMALAKGLGGGFPIGACLATEHAAAGMVVGTHGSTYGGNPLAMAAGNAVMDVVDTPEFLDHVRTTGAQLRAALEEMASRHSWLFGEVRGIGLMLGVKLSRDSRSVVGRARDFGILTVAAADDVMRILPPLTINEAHIDECVARLSALAQALEAEKAETLAAD